MSTRVSIDALPEKPTLTGSEFFVIQDGSVTRKVGADAVNESTETLLQAHINDADAAHTASAVSAAPAGGALTGTTVQAQLGQAASQLTALGAQDGSIGGSLTNHLLATADAHDASAISYVPGGSFPLSSTQVQAALTELGDSKAGIFHSHPLIQDGDKGDIAVGNSGTTLTIDPDAVVNSKLANIGTNTIKGRVAAGTGDPEDLTAAQARAVIASDSGGGTVNYLNAAGQWTTPPGQGAPVRSNLGNKTATTYAPVVADENSLFTMTNAGTITITMPSNATQAFPISAEIRFVWYGVGQPVFVAGSGATIVSRSGWLKIAARYGVVTAKKLGTSEWLLYGDLAA